MSFRMIQAVAIGAVALLLSASGCVMEPEEYEVSSETYAIDNCPNDDEQDPHYTDSSRDEAHGNIHDNEGGSMSFDLTGARGRGRLECTWGSSECTATIQTTRPCPPGTTPTGGTASVSCSGKYVECKQVSGGWHKCTCRPRYLSLGDSVHSTSSPTNCVP